MSKLVTQNLEDLLKPFNNTQRMYVSLVVMGYTPQQACAEIDRKPVTIDRYLTDINFRELVDFAVLNRDKFREEARMVWLDGLDSRKMVLMDKIMDYALNAFNGELKGGDIRMINLAMTIGGVSSGGGDDYDELILKKHRKVNG